MALTILDAGVVIGILDGNDPHHEASRAAVAAALTRGDELAIPASAYAECLVGPARQGRDAVGAVDAFLSDLPADVEPITGRSRPARRSCAPAMAGGFVFRMRWCWQRPCISALTAS